MSLPTTTSGYALGPDEGEPLWFNGALGILKATAKQTGGRFTAYELRMPKGFAAPLHSHRNEDEFFLVLSGEVRLQHADEVITALPGTLAYTPSGVGHSFHAVSEEASLLMFFGPAGVEEFFREVATPARWFGPPPADEPRKDPETLIDIMTRHGQTLLGPPLGAED